MKLIKVRKLELFGLQCYIGSSCERRGALIPLKDARIVLGPARPIHLYFLVDPSPGRGRGQPPGIARVDGRAKEGRLLKRIRKGILDHLSAQGGEPSIVHHSLTERAAWLEFNISYVQNNFRASDITQLRRILKDHPAARLAIVNFYRDHSATTQSR